MPGNTLSRLLASQPIYDTRGELYAVELLYRNDNGQTVLDIGEEQATSELLFNLCTGITDQVEHYLSPAFINVSSDFLLSRQFLPIDPELVVVELVERITPTREVVDAVRAWHAEGFRFALDDFEFGDDWAPLRELAAFIKVDVSQHTPEQIEHYRRASPAGNVLWLAERIEDAPTHRRFMDMGFDLFQGYFYARPTIIYGKKLSPSALQLARLLALLYEDEPDTEAVIKGISSDPGLAMSLIRVVNSPLYRASTELHSVRDVVLRMGFENLRRWVVLIGVVNATSPETARIVLVRAQVCSELAKRSRQGIAPDNAFLAGLLSGADALFQVEKEVFLKQIQIPAELYSALMTGEGPIGKLIALAQQLERAVMMQRGLDQMDPRLLKLYMNTSHHVQTLFNEM